MAITQTKESQASLSAAEIVEMLKAGNARFLGKDQINRDLNAQVNQTSTGQFPFAAVLSCIDSRVPVETVFDLGIGDVFSCRIAGNFINEDILGSLEFACKVAGSKVIVILGHSSCGAVKGAIADVKLGNLTGMLSRIKPAVDAVRTDMSDSDDSDPQFIQACVDKNVEFAMRDLKAKSPVLKEMIDAGEVLLIGAMYHVDSGAVDFHM